MEKRTRNAAIFAAAASSLFMAPRRCLGANQIYLQGVVPAVCVIGVTPNPSAAALPLTLTAAQRILVGAILQNCNKKNGFTLTLTSANCSAPATGAKVVDAVSGEFVPYSVELNNPTTGGSQAVVANLLAGTCLNAVGRDVLNAKIIDESSFVYVNYTGSAQLAAGTYQDTLTITLSLK